MEPPTSDSSTVPDVELTIEMCKRLDSAPAKSVKRAWSSPGEHGPGACQYHLAWRMLHRGLAELIHKRQAQKLWPHRDTDQVNNPG